MYYIKIFSSKKEKKKKLLTAAHLIAVSQSFFSPVYTKGFETQKIFDIQIKIMQIEGNKKAVKLKSIINMLKIKCSISRFQFLLYSLHCSLLQKISLTQNCGFLRLSVLSCLL